MDCEEDRTLRAVLAGMLREGEMPGANQVVAAERAAWSPASQPRDAEAEGEKRRACIRTSDTPTRPA
jgi:hypothetical protein